MGAGIAAHLAAAGCKTHLLDIVPKDASGRDRSRIAQGALKALAKSRPPALMSTSLLSRLLPGNLDDDLERAVGESDLVIEAVVERLDVKMSLFNKVAAAAKADAILATNTSGIPIDAIAAGLSEDAAGRFLGLHFFNPPRWMHLLEVIPGSRTKKSVLASASRFCDVALGKGIVPCRDTPNFIGNRVGIAEMLLTFRAAKQHGLTVEEVDFLNGPLLGRPKTGSFRLGDLVGLDIVGHVVGNLKEGLCAEVGAENFDPLYEIMSVPEVVKALVASQRLGDKSGAGFYKKAKDEKGRPNILSLDLVTLEYRDRIEPEFPELAQSLKLHSLEDRVKNALRAEGKSGDFVRAVLFPLFNYAAALTGIICETPQQIDDAMRWGYGWQLGPFQLLDAAGPSWVVEQLEKSGTKVSDGLAALVQKDGTSARFYAGPDEDPTVWVPGKGAQAVALPEGALFLNRLRSKHTIEENRSASLIDLGDGIACLEFRSKANILDDGVVTMIARAPEFLSEKGFKGMVLGNQADHFCRGANLMHIAGLIAQKNFSGIEAAIQTLQNAFMGLRHGPIPVVAAPIGQTFGGGTEACLHCAKVQAGADLFMGLVEVGVGVLPAGGGLKEIARRASEWAAQVPDQDPYHAVRRGFEAVATAKVSMSAMEARENGFLSAQDGITFHKSRVIQDAKSQALGLAHMGWVPPDREELISVIGAPGGANLMMGVQLFEWGGYASEHDKHIGQKIVHVLSGGMNVEKGQVTAQTLLDLEREAFVSLCGEEKTFARIQTMLKTKRPLRN
jgi:3-hydroxyacyl-CoA dehydrogenase